MTKGRNERILW